MNENLIIFSTFLIFAGATILSTAALLTRQALLIAYIILGMLLGPYGLKLIANINVIHRVGDVGIIFLLFLLGLNLNPRDLWHLLKKTSVITLASSLVFLLLGFVISSWFGFNHLDSIVIGIALMFSSTIVCLKLMPSTHHKPIRELIISILLLQDLIAVFALLFLDFAKIDNIHLERIALTTLALPILILFGFVFTRFVLMKLFARFYHLREYVLLTAIGWCLSFAELANAMGLSYEIGAFIAGVTIATGPISLYIYDNLKPVRDFFLVVFFFSVGASFDIAIFAKILLPVLVLTIALIVAKPLVFKTLLRFSGESKTSGWEIGFRLGQASCFSLLIAQLGFRDGIISDTAAQIIQSVTTLTFIASSYLVVSFYPTPIGTDKQLQTD